MGDHDAVERLFTMAWRAQVGKFVQLSGVYRARTGYFFDPRAGSGYDLNGDGNYNDRTPGFTKNFFEGPGNHVVDARLAWVLPLKNDRRLQFLVEGYNVFNRDNVRTVFTTYGPTQGSPLALFMQPLTYWPPREIQLGVRLVF